MVRGILAGEALNEFYPKVVFREDGLIELLESGPGALTGKDFIVEPVGEWTGHMFYQGLDGAKLISVREGVVEITDWVTQNGSYGFNDFNNTLVSSDTPAFSNEAHLIDETRYRMTTFPILVDFGSFMLHGPVVDKTTSEFGVLKIVDASTHEFIGFTPTVGTYDSNSFEWSAHLDYINGGGVALRGAVIALGQDDWYGVCHLDAATGQATLTEIPWLKNQYNSVVYVDDRMYIFTERSVETDGDLFVYELQEDNTFSLLYRRPQPETMVDTDIIHGGYGMPLSVKTRNDVILITDWGDNGNARVRAYAKNGVFLWKVDDEAGAGIFTDEAVVHSSRQFIPTTAIGHSTGNVMYGAIVEDAAASVRLMCYELDLFTGELLDTRVLLDSPSLDYFEILTEVAGYVYLVHDWTTLYKVELATGTSTSVTLPNDIIFDSIYATTKEGSIVFYNYANGITVVPMGDITKVIEYAPTNDYDFDRSGNAYILRPGKIIYSMQALVSLPNTGGVYSVDIS